MELFVLLCCNLDTMSGLSGTERSSVIECCISCQNWTKLFKNGSLLKEEIVLKTEICRRTENLWKVNEIKLNKEKRNKVCCDSEH